MPASAISLTVKTPVAWLNALVKEVFSEYYDGDSISRILLSKESSQYRVTFFQELAGQLQVSPPPLGPAGQAFLQKSEALGKSWCPPYSGYKIKDFADLLATLNDDLTTDPNWPNFQNLLDEKAKVLKEVTEAPEIILKEFCQGYRAWVIHNTYFHVKQKNENKEQYILNDLHAKEAMYIVNQCVDSSDQAIEQRVYRLCQTQLKKDVSDILQDSKYRAENSTYLLHISYHLKNQIHILRHTPEFEMLSDMDRDIIIQPLNDYLTLLNAGMRTLNAFLLKICKQAKLGVIINYKIAEAFDGFLHSADFSHFYKLGALPVVRYLNSPEMIKWIHDIVIRVRVNEIKDCVDDVNNIPLMREWLRKATHYRVRRNIIEVLFFESLRKFLSTPTAKIWRKNYISKEQQDVLQFLQDEYLHAINLQTELMDKDTKVQFLIKFQTDAVLQPLPRTGLFHEANKSALSALQMTISEEQDQKRKKLKPREEPPLGHIDCPIEQDIIGDISKRLADIILHHNQRSEKFIKIFELLEFTYHKLVAPDFEIEALIEDYALQNDFEKVSESIHQEQDIQLQLERILELYEHIQSHQHWETGQVEVSQKAHSQHKMIGSMHDLFIECLETLFKRAPPDSDHEKALLYERVVIPALETPLFNNDLVPELCKKAKQKIQQLCKKYLIE